MPMFNDETVNDRIEREGAHLGSRPRVSGVVTPKMKAKEEAAEKAEYDKAKADHAQWKNSVDRMIM